MITSPIMTDQELQNTIKELIKHMNNCHPVDSVEILSQALIVEFNRVTDEINELNERIDELMQTREKIIKIHHVIPRP